MEELLAGNHQEEDIVLNFYPANTHPTELGSSIGLGQGGKYRAVA